MLRIIMDNPTFPTNLFASSNIPSKRSSTGEINKAYKIDKNVTLLCSFHHKIIVETFVSGADLFYSRIRCNKKAILHNDNSK